MIKGQITLIRNKRKGGEGYRDVSGVCEKETVKCQELSGTDGRGGERGQLKRKTNFPPLSKF